MPGGRAEPSASGRTMRRAVLAQSRATEHAAQPLPETARAGVLVEGCFLLRAGHPAGRPQVLAQMAVLDQPASEAQPVKVEPASLTGPDSTEVLPAPAL